MIIMFSDEDHKSTVSLHGLDRAETDAKVPGLTWTSRVSSEGLNYLESGFDLGMIHFDLYTKREAPTA